MSQELNPLSLKELSATVRLSMPRLSEQVRLRLREEMAKRQMSQRDMAGVLGWTQSRVAHILTGRVEMSVDDLAEFAFGLGIAVTEAVRDRGMEFCAEMAPYELRLLEQIRQLPQTDREAFLQVLGVKMKTVAPERRASGPTPPKRKSQ